jgi:hypothetical protein
MKTNFEKIYVGKGKNPQPWVTRLTLNVDELVKHAHEYEGKQFVTIEVVQLKEPDNFGRTHAAYISKRAESEEQPEETKPSRRKKK